MTILSRSLRHSPLVVWLSCLLILSLISNIVIISHALEECQEQQGTSSYAPGQSNADFLKRITLHREQQSPDEDTEDKKTDSKDPFDFFGLFDGSARDTDSESFLDIAKFFQSSGGSDEKDSFDFDLGLAGIFGRKEGRSHVGHNKEKETQNDEWWNIFRQRVPKKEEFLTNIFLQTGANERKEGFFDILRVFSQAFDEVKKHLDGESRVLLLNIE